MKLIKKLFKSKPKIYQFHKMDAELLDCEYDGWIFEKVYDHISDILEPNLYPPSNVEWVEGAPQSIKNISYLWLFAAEVGGNGLFDFIINRQESESDAEWLAVNNALIAIGANEVQQRFESMVVLGFELNDIKYNHDQSQYSHFKLHEQFNTYDLADDGIYQLMNDSFDQLAANYIRKFKEDIFAIE